MMRTTMILASAVAFAAPIALSQPASARPLVTAVEPAEWCWGCGNDVTFDLTVCFEAQVGIHVDRAADSCEILSGRECHARCTPEAVASSCALTLGADAQPRSLALCGAERLDLCREQCDSGGAGFCALRWDGEKNEIVFVDVDICIDLKVDLDR